MKSSLFLLFNTFVFAVVVVAHTYFHLRFVGVEKLQAKIESQEQNIEQLSIQNQLAAWQFSDFRQYVATLMPEALRGYETGEKGYPLRNLASIAKTHDLAYLEIERASTLFEEGKRAFRKQDFPRAEQSFRKLLETYPGSAFFLETQFLLVETQFQTGDLEGCVVTIESMLNLHPESELTGYSLLRLGKIYEKQERLEDAAEIYTAIEKSFQEPELQKQARQSRKMVEL